jgi:hypothetical protein
MVAFSWLPRIHVRDAHDLERGSENPQKSLGFWEVVGESLPLRRRDLLNSMAILRKGLLGLSTLNPCEPRRAPAYGTDGERRTALSQTAQYRTAPLRRGKGVRQPVGLANPVG